MLIAFYLSQLRASLIAVEYEAPIDTVKSKLYKCIVTVLNKNIKVYKQLLTKNIVMKRK